MKYIYFFSQKKSEGRAEMKDLLGGKGANLAQMGRLGLPIPPGFTISTEVCTYFYKNNQNYPPNLEKEIKKNLAEVEKAKKAKFGDWENPLLFSVRSGARVSMPGMMDTVLNLGLNDEIVKRLAEKNPRFAWNSYWRFIFMFADVVMGVEKEELDEIKGNDWKDVTERLKAKVKHLTGREVPQDPWEQLWQAISAVFKSWNTPRAITYRKLNKIPDDWGTAVNCQSMVFGNFDENSASGVGFTRNPATGEKKLYGEFLSCAQGEDVVAGIRTPRSIDDLKKVFPQCYEELLKISDTLENYYKDMQDIEFTIESGKLWMLQTRTGKRTTQAAIKIALDMVSEGLVDKKTALLRIDPYTIESLFKPSFDPKTKKEVIAKGLAASPGAAVGEVVFNPEEAVELVDQGHKVILVRKETSPEDIHGIAVAEGVLTARGGMTSHAALVTRAMGKPGIVGCEAIGVDYEKGYLQAGDKIIKKGEKISIDGTTGEVILGELPTQLPKISGDLEEILTWADEIRKLGVYTNADTPTQAKKARDLGAEGIGLCRTEHMFFEENRITVFQQMVLSKDKKDRESALAKILPLQKGDFLEIFKVMEGRPVIIRLLDPPLHEFLPQKDEDIKDLAGKLGLPFEELKNRVENLRELNPMLGHRGVRLGITFPEIYEMQARAIMEAAGELAEVGKKVIPKIMIPLTMDLEEFRLMKEIVKKVCEEVRRKLKTKVDYKVGTMIEIPRAALLAGEIAKEAEFFSFGTNDLTQTTLGISRDDAGRFLPLYLDKKILRDDPFISVDRAGVGELMKICQERGRTTRPDIEIGICGEHGGDPRTVEFCHHLGLNYVSCSPFRVPIARLAAAQGILRK
jgi:pyruvate,orthophosphate dikinase